MLENRKIRIRLISVAFGAAALLIPISISGGEEPTVEITEACASGTCCPEIGSTCPTEVGELVNRYKSSAGCDVQRRTQ